MAANAWLEGNKALFLQKYKYVCMTTNRDEDIYRKVHFAVMAIEASAKKADVSGREMYDRLKRQGLIHKRLFRHYDMLHTQSLDWVADDTVETLRNWEKEEEEAGR